MRKLVTLLVVLVILAGLLVGLDRGGAYLVSRELASKIQTSQGLSEKPTVEIHGFPFLTQVIGGKYTSIDITARDLTSNGVRLSSVTVHAMGVHVSLSDAVSGKVTQVPVDHGTGTVVIDYAELNVLAKKFASVGGAGITLSSAGGNKVNIGGSLSEFGISTGITAEAQVTATNDTLHVIPLSSTLDLLPSAIRDKAEQVLTIDIPLPNLPFGLHLQSGTVTPEGVSATAGGSMIVIPVKKPTT